MGKKPLKIFLALALVLLGVGIAMGVAEKDFVVRSFSPKGEAEGRAQIKAVFNSDVVSADDVGRALSAAEMPFIFTPQIPGEGKWSDTKTFVLTPNGGRLAPATRYTALVNPWLRDLGGRRLSGPKSFTFNTAPQKFIRATQTNLERDAGRVYYELEFSLPASPQQLSGYLSVTHRGRRLDHSLARGQTENIVILSIPYFDKEAELTIVKGYPSIYGPLGLEKEAKITLRPSLSMTILDSNVQSGTRTSSIFIGTNATVDIANAQPFVTVSPQTKYVIEPQRRGFVIAGDFKPQDRITVTIKKGFPSLEGPVLEKDWTRAFIIPDKQPQVKIDAGGRVITPASSLRIPVEMVNIDKLNVRVWKLYENNIPIAMKDDWGYFSMDLSRMIFNKSYTVAGKPNETSRRALDLKEPISGDRGVFLVMAEDETARSGSSRAILNVTDLGVTAKLGPNSVFAWVNSIQTGEPVYGAKVTFWSWANQPVAEAQTDIRGVASAELPADEDSRPVIATVTKGGDTSFVRLTNGLFRGSDEIDTSGCEWLYRGYSALCYMPRDIFRPGETVPFRAVVRDVNNIAPKPFPLTLKLFTPTGKQWGERTVKLTDEGTFSVDVEIPIDAMVGTWQARLFAPGEETSIGYKDFFIEEFAPPRLFVDASADKTYLVGEDSASLQISSRYVFGGSASGLPWEAQQTVRTKTFSPDGWQMYYFYDAEAKTSSIPEGNHIGSGQLDEDGAAKAEINSRLWQVPSMALISARAGVMEEGGRWVYKTVTLDWYPREVMAGISMPDDGIEVGKQFEFKAAAVTIDGKAANVKKLNYTIFRKVTQSVLYETDGQRRSRTQNELLERAKGEIKLKDGSGAASFTPEHSGQYLIRVEDPDSGAKASHYFYAYQSYYGGGDGEPQETNLPDRVELTTDKKEYKTGEVVKVKVKAPFAGQLLLSVETYKQVHRVTRDMGGKEEIEVAFRANEFMLPNAWITAQVVKPAKGAKKGEQYRAYGAAALMMDNSPSKLTVEIDKIGTVEPGSLDISLTVKDARGKGAAAEVTVMLTDETVLGLTGWQSPDPWGYFTALRRLGMETYDLYNAIIAPEAMTTPLLTPGGDGYSEARLMAGKSLSPVKAQRFKILSLTKTVTAAANGKATASFSVPEFAGTVRVTAVAVSAKAAGNGEAPAAINRDIALEPSLPRALAPKDVLTAPLNIFNLSDKDIETRITITPSGPIRLDGEPKFSVNVKAGQNVMRELAFTGTGYGVARVVFSAEWQGGKIEQEIELPVRPAAPRVSENKAEVIDPGKSATLDLAGDWFPGTKSGRVMLSAMPQISVADVTQYLITYPYGCLEQTVSSAWPVLTMPELVAAVDPMLATKEALSGSLRVRIQRILGLQNYDGGFSRWPGQGWSHAWDSIYTTHLLIEANKRGEQISQASINHALDFVRGQLNAPPVNDSTEAWSQTLTRRAYACYVLALAGEKQLGWMSSLHDRLNELSPSARLLLAAAYGEVGDKRTAAAMLGGTLEVIKTEPGGNDIYDSNLRNKALALLARTHLDPASPEAASAAYTLLNSFKAARYYSTQEGGFSMLALARYFSAQPAGDKPAGSIKDASGKTVAELSDKTRIISADVGSETAFTMVNSGNAKLFTASTVGGVPTKPVDATDSGITLRQTLRDRNGNTVTDSVRRGEVLTATVEITPTAGTLRNIVVAIPLPAGLEVENPRLTGGEGELPYNARVELRDDRVLLFIDIISNTMRWRYSVRPVTAGKFTVPQISAECMYDPAVQSISGGGTLEVKNAE